MRGGHQLTGYRNHDCQFNAAAVRLFRKIPRGQRKTLTTDNGSEFIEHRKLSSRLGFKTFFADPYASTR